MTENFDEKNSLNEEDKKKQLKPEEDPNFRNKDEEQKEAEEEQKENDELEQEDHTIRPESHQQRNLDRETGGFESDIKKANFTSQDVWDDRSEEVDKMSSKSGFSFKDFVLEKKRKERAMAKRIAKEALASGLDIDKDAIKNIVLKSGGQQKTGLLERLKGFKQDHSHENDGGGMGR